MRIAIDASSVPARPAGAGVYAIELVRALAAREPRHDGFALFASGRWPRDIVGGRRDWRLEPAPRSRARRLAWEQAVLPQRLAKLGIDALHSTHHTLPLRLTRVARIVTVHDVTFFRIPERYPLARRLYMQAMTRLSARVADAIIVPSATVRDDVVATLRVSRERVHVVYEAASASYVPVAPDEARAVATRYGLEPPYVLSVGSREPGKNRVRLFEALARLRAEGCDARVAVAGQPAWGAANEDEVVRRLGLRDAVRFLGYVPAADIPALYSAATAFVFPSLYEGFGLPVIEAMACGTPVLTSRVSATAEVAGDAALLVDPLSVDEIVGGLRRLLTDAVERARLRERGLVRAAQFSWARAAEETHMVYREAAERRSGA